MQEQLDHRGGWEPIALRKGDWIDAHELVVGRGPDEGAEGLEQVGRDGSRGGESLEPLGQKRLVRDRCGGGVGRLARPAAGAHCGCGTIRM